LNLETVAKAAGVSVATASLALNDHPRVAARTKQHVLEVAARIGYVPHQAARRLVRSHVRKDERPLEQVGFIFFDSLGVELDLLYLSLMRGIEYELSRHGITMAFLRVSNEVDRTKVARFVQSGWVDGWLMVGNIDDSTLDLVGAGNLPGVIVGQHHCKRPVHCVDMDYTAIGRMGVEYLAGLGHRRIAYFGGTMRYLYQHDMLHGYKSAVQALGLDLEEHLIQVWKGTQLVPLETRMEEALTPSAPATAAFGSELNMAQSLVDILRQRFELQVPADISVVTTQLDAGATANMTRIEFPCAEVGRAGAALLREIATQPKSAPRRVLVAPKLIEGWSCRRLTNEESNIT